MRASQGLGCLKTQWNTFPKIFKTATDELG